MSDDKLIYATDYLVEEMVLYSLSTKTGFDISSMMEELNIFDSIFQTSISGNIVIRDSVGLIEKLPIAGNETLNVRLVKPGTDGNEKIEKTFRIYKLADRKPRTNLTEIYTLHFCSYQQFFSEQVKVSKGYIFKTYADIARDILENDLQLTGKNEKFYVEPTFGNLNVTLPGMTPLQTCQWLAKRSLNSASVPSFLFFQNLGDGFVFSSLENLYSQFDTTLEYEHNIQTDPNSDRSDKLFGVNYSEFDQGFNMLTAIKEGVFASVNYGIDFVTLSFEKTEFDASKYEGQNTLLNRNGNVNKVNLVGIDGQSATSKTLSTVKITPLTNNQLKSSYIKSHDKTVFPNDTDKITSQRQHILQNLLNNKVYLGVPGLMSLNAGRVIKINFLERNVREKTDADELDDLHSGKYIITSTRHTFTPDGVYRTFMECATDSYGKSQGTGQRVTIDTITGNADFNA